MLRAERVANPLLELVDDLRLMVLEYLDIADLVRCGSAHKMLQATITANDALFQWPLLNSKYRHLFDKDGNQALFGSRWRVLAQELFSRRCACCGNAFDVHPFELSFDTGKQRDQFLQLSSQFSDPVMSAPTLKRLLRVSRRLPGRSTHQPIQKLDGSIKTTWVMGALSVEMTADVTPGTDDTATTLIKNAAYYFSTTVPVAASEGGPWRLLLALLPGDTYLLKYSRRQETLQLGFWYELTDEGGDKRSIIDMYPPSDGNTSSGKTKRRDLREEATQELRLYLRSASSFRLTALERYDVLLEKALARRSRRRAGSAGRGSGSGSGSPSTDEDEAAAADERMEEMVARKAAAIESHYEGFFRALAGLASSFPLVTQAPTSAA
jgi:hypothetical protein